MRNVQTHLIVLTTLCLLIFVAAACGIEPDASLTAEPTVSGGLGALSIPTTVTGPTSSLTPSAGTDIAPSPSTPAQDQATAVPATQALRPAAIPALTASEYFATIQQKARTYEQLRDRLYSGNRIPSLADLRYQMGEESRLVNIFLTDLESMNPPSELEEVHKDYVT